MDINPEDIENMSVLKGPAAAALYGSRASAGVVIITTKKGKEGRVEVNLSAKYITSWVKDLPKTQNRYRRGFLQDNYDKAGNYIGTTFDDFAYNSWGTKVDADTPIYDNIGDFFQQAGAWDTNLSISGGTKNSNFFLSGSFYDQDGIIPTTGIRCQRGLLTGTHRQDHHFCSALWIKRIRYNVKSLYVVAYRRHDSL